MNKLILPAIIVVATALMLGCTQQAPSTNTTGGTGSQCTNDAQCPSGYYCAASGCRQLGSTTNTTTYSSHCQRDEGCVGAFCDNSGCATTGGTGTTGGTPAEVLPAGTGSFSWCAPGTVYTGNADTPGAGSVQLNINGMSSYNGQPACKLTYKVTDTMTLTYYFDAESNLLGYNYA